jgi:hypothetical protein
MQIPELPNVVVGTTIPRLLHQTFPRLDMPDPLRRNVEELRARNPGWEYRLYDDAAIESFILQHYGAAILGYYRRINPEYGAARADLFRYLALYRLGGVYLDVKSRFLRPIDEVLRDDDRFIVSRWRNGEGEPHQGWGLHPDLAEFPGGEIQQWHIIAAPGQPFLKAVIDMVLAGIDGYTPYGTGVGWIGVLRLTGPIAYTRAIVPLLSSCPCRTVDNESVLGLEYSALDRSDHQSLFKKHYTRNTDPVVLRRGLKRLLDLGYIEARALKGKLGSNRLALERRGGEGIAPEPVHFPGDQAVPGQGA